MILSNYSRIFTYLFAFQVKISSSAFCMCMTRSLRWMDGWIKMPSCDVKRYLQNQDKFICLLFFLVYTKSAISCTTLPVCPHSILYWLLVLKTNRFVDLDEMQPKCVNFYAKIMENSSQRQLPSPPSHIWFLLHKNMRYFGAASFWAKKPGCNIGWNVSENFGAISIYFAKFFNLQNNHATKEQSM